MNQLLGDRPKAAMLLEADFVQGTEQYSELATDIDFFSFPPLAAGGARLGMVGGDVAVMLHDTPQARELIQYLATPAAGQAWARVGGFISPNLRVGLNVYPNRVTQRAAAAIVGSGLEDRLVFDMSDQAPRAFGATAGSGEWGDLQTWLANPDDIAGTEAMLECDAAAAYPPRNGQPAASTAPCGPPAGR
jgi:alpha-glucoside transport system substrate-binding protein